MKNWGPLILNTFVFFDQEGMGPFVANQKCKNCCLRFGERTYSNLQ